MAHEEFEAIIAEEIPKAVPAKLSTAPHSAVFC